MVQASDLNADQWKEGLRVDLSQLRVIASNLPPGSSMAIVGHLQFFLSRARIGLPRASQLMFVEYKEVAPNSPKDGDQFFKNKWSILQAHHLASMRISMRILDHYQFTELFNGRDRAAWLASCFGVTNDSINSMTDLELDLVGRSAR